MTIEKNGHRLESEVESFYQGKKVKYWCINEGCFIDIESEYSARDKAEELARENQCPMEPGECMFCDRDVLQEIDICNHCRIDRGRVVKDLDEDRKNREGMICNECDNKKLRSKSRGWYCPFCDNES